MSIFNIDLGPKVVWTMLETALIKTKYYFSSFNVRELGFASTFSFGVYVQNHDWLLVVHF